MTLQPLHALFADQHAAELAIARLATLGISHDKLHTFSSAGAAHIGSFADDDHHAHTPERDHVGSFADDDHHAHTPERDHVGSFADSDNQGATKRQTLEDALIAAGLHAADAKAAAGRIAAGAVLVLVEAQPDQADLVAGALSQGGGARR